VHTEDNQILYRKQKEMKEEIEPYLPNPEMKIENLRMGSGVYKK
jgi:hypothetical protein